MSEPSSSHPLGGDLDAILAGARAEFEQLRGTRIFLTGGTGFIGTWLVESFGWANARLGLGAELVVLTRDPAGFVAREAAVVALSGVTLWAGDIRTFDFPPGPFTHVIHAATPASAKLNVDSPLLMLDTIVAGTRRVLDFAVAAGAKRVLQTTSGAVYGRQPDTLTHLPEDYPGGPSTSDPWSAYGEGKRAAELMGTLYATQHGFDHTVARIFALVGPRLPLDIHYALGNFIRDALAGGPIQVGGDGTPLRSYLYISDLVVALWVILVRGTSLRPYNVGSPEAVSIAEAARAVNAALGLDREIRIAGRAMPGQPGNRYVPSVERLERELGLRPTVGLAEGIRRTARWSRPV